jgi:hypothetical protein
MMSPGLRKAMSTLCKRHDACPKQQRKVWETRIMKRIEHKILRQTWASALALSLMVGLAMTLAARAESPLNISKNLLKNPGFEQRHHGGTSQVFEGQGPGQSAAKFWTTWLNEHGTITTQLLTSTSLPKLPCAPLIGKNTVIHVKVHGPGGIVQQWQGSGGPPSVISSVRVFVISGQVQLGTGNGGNTHGDAFSKKTGGWEVLKAPNGEKPANELIVYGKTPSAEYCVDNARVVRLP